MLTPPGIDEGLISGTLSKTHFVHLLGLDKMEDVELANVKGNISAMVQIGSVGGAALYVFLGPIKAVLIISVPSFSVIASVVSGLHVNSVVFGFSESLSSSQTVVVLGKYMLVDSLPVWGSGKPRSSRLCICLKSHQSLFEVFAPVLSLALYILVLCLHILHHGEVSFTLQRVLAING